MRICFDLRALQIGHENRGIGMHIRSILEHIDDSDNEYVFYAFDKGDPIVDLKIDFKGTYSLVQTPTVSTVVASPKDFMNVLRLSLHRFKPLRAEMPDVFVQFDFNLGLPRFRKLKKVVIAYDLIPLIMRNEYLPNVGFAWQHSPGKKAKIMAVSRSLYYQLKYKISYRTFKKADQLVSISNSTRQSFIDLLGVRQSIITTLPLAPVLNFDQVDTSVADSIDKPYVFYVGGSDTRKRIVDVVRAFHIAKGRGLDIALVLGGHDIKDVKKLADVAARNAILHSPYREDIHLVGFISDAEKLGLYQNAHAFVFCSVFEGFGLPVIEAMASGCPVVSYNNTSIPEAAGDAALLVETNDYVAVAREVMRLSDPDLRKKLINKGYEHAKRFSWDEYSSRFLSLLTNKR
jgi:glycosyltransferase involved in cell wall biosynthesis